MSIIKNYKVILLDMNSTFMFGEDRFSEDEDFYNTYRTVGGSRLSASRVKQEIMRCYEGLSKDYVNPVMFDNFPTLAEGFAKYARVDDDDLQHLIDVFSLHERGVVPDEYADKIKSLAKTHELALVANIWAPRKYWFEELRRVGVLEQLKTVVWSAEEGCIKPCKTMFEKALSQMSCAASDAVFIGDSLACDMQGAKPVGLTTIWIDPDMRQHPAVDYTIPNLLALN